MNSVLAASQAELRNAIAEDRAARAEALRRGVIATQPLTAARLAELCALGVRMMETRARREQAMKQLLATHAADAGVMTSSPRLHEASLNASAVLQIS